MKQRLVQDSQRIKQQYDEVNIEEAEIDEMIALLKTDNEIDILE